MPIQNHKVQNENAQNEKIGLIAGNGKFPFLVLDAARAVVRSLAPRLPSDALALALFAILGVGGAIVAATILYRSVEVGFTSRLRRRKRPAPNGRRGRVGGPRAGMEGDQWR